MRHVILSVALTTALVILLVVSAGAARADDSAWKAANDTDPHLPLTQQQLEMTAEKRAAEVQSGAGLTAWTGRSSTCGAACGGGGGYPGSASLAANQTPQARVTTAVRPRYTKPWARSESGFRSQPLRRRSTRHPKAPRGPVVEPRRRAIRSRIVLNRYQGRNFYVPQPVSSPTSSAIDTYESDLEADIYSVRAPLVGDAWETRYSTYHLSGHPADRTIFHWFEIRGYQSYGASTMYEDSVHNAASVSWYASVPAYSTMASSAIVSIISGRGYVW